ncbi:MAG: family 10 glycosylhydrolase [Phycisphaerales bacterium]
MTRLAAIGAALMGAAVLASCSASPRAGLPAPAPGSWADEPIRGVWVTRWDYRTEGDVARAMHDIRSLGVTDVFWQVRGQADAFYPSHLEPWAEEMLDAEGNPPAFDPLAIAVREAHANGLRIHAWINAMPLWRGTTPPKNPDHPFHAKPQWRLTDPSGELQPLNDHYVIVNPLRRDVRDHLVAVGRDLVTRYNIDGLHLDYIRFVTDAMDTSRTYPAGDSARALLRERTGSDTLDTPEQRQALRDLIEESITRVVERMDREAAGARDGVMLTAAVWRRPDLARDQYEQAAADWANRGVVDAVIPMIYTTDHERFGSDLAAWRAECPDARIVPGVGIYKHDHGDLFRAQSEHPEFVAFAYSSMFTSRASDQEPSPRTLAERVSLRRAVRERAEPDR